MHLYTVAIVVLVAAYLLFLLAILRAGSMHENAIRGEFLNKLPLPERIRYWKLFLNF